MFLSGYFVRQRSIGQRKDNLNVRTFRYQDNTMRNSKDLYPFLVTHTENDGTFTLSYKQYLKNNI